MTMLTYTIDSGNTFVKIGVFKGSTLEEVHRIKSEDFKFQFKDDSSIIYSNVSKDISNSIPDHAICASRLIKNFKTAYDKDRLGLDRKIISHYLQNQQSANTLLIDAGSFITFDEIRDGIHYGGPIYLGLVNYLRAYPTFSQNLPLIDPNNLGQDSSTKQAINKAFDDYLKMITGEIKKYSSYNIVITGGDAHYFAPFGEIDDNLMHKALFSLQD